MRHISSKVNSLALAILFLPLLVYGAKGISIENSVVDRVATEVTLSFDGKIISYNTNSFDIKNALEEKGVSVGEFDVVEPSLSTKLTGGEVVVKIKRAERFLLDDDGRKSFIFSAYEEPRKILEQNKIKFFPEDKIYFDLIFDFYGDDSLGKKIILKRAPILYVNVDGEKKELHSWKSTVSEALEEKGILVGEKDRVTPDRETFVTNKIEVTIVRVAESEVKEMVAIPYSTQVIEDPNLEYGKTYVKQAGINGAKEKTYKIISENGIMVSKTLISTVVTKEAQGKVVVKGTKIVTGKSYTGIATSYPGPTKVACNLFKKGTILKITNLNTGKLGVYVVDDTGGFGGNVIVDLREDIFYELGGTKFGGIFPVKIEQVLN